MFMKKSSVVLMMKSRFVVVHIMFFLVFSILIFNTETLSKIERSDNDDVSIPPKINYNATSSEEIFNETSFPRYKLAARPFGIIHYPNKINPVIKLIGESISVEVSSSSETTNWNFTMIEGNITVSLEVLKTTFFDDFWTIETLPSIQRAGFYDLQLNCSEGSDYQTHAIQIVEEKNYPFTFIQITDLHLPFYSEDINTTNIALDELDNIKALNPDFIVVTGDLIQGPTTYMVDPETGKTVSAELQYKLGIWYLDLFNLPVYYIHGNHEFSQSSLVPDILRDQWYRYFGPTRYQNYTYLDWTFVGFGSSFEGLTQAEYDAVAEILAQNSNGSTVLYYHYDFQSHASALIKKFPIELALYGHLHYSDLYLYKDTLYNLESPLFHRAFSTFTINNETCLSVHSQTFNFELRPYIPPTPTPSTPSIEDTSFSTFILILGLMVYYQFKRKKSPP